MGLLTPEALKSLAGVLQVYGGWGMTVILMAAVIALYKNTGKILEKRNDQFVDVLRECGTVLGQTEDKLREVSDRLVQFTNVNERVLRLLERVEDRLDRPR